MSSLHDQFEPDFEDVFADLDEFACIKTFEIVDNGGPVRFTTSVVWDTETLKERAVVQQQGLYLGDVLCFIGKKWFASEPQPEEILYEITYRGKLPVRIGWRVLDIVDAERVYELSLVRLTTIA